MIRQILFLATMLCFVGTLQAQDPIFSQFYSTPMVLNPAFAGNTLAPRLAVNYRKQWTAIEGPQSYETFGASYSQFMPGLNSGIGFLLVSDDSGDGLYKTNKFGATFAYRVEVNRNFNIKIGVEAGFRSLNLDWERFVWFDQLDAITGPVDAAGNPNPTNEIRPDLVSKTHFDVGAGILAYGPVFYGGFSIKHLTAPNEGLLGINDQLNEGLTQRMSLHGGAQLELRKANNRRGAMYVSPNLMVIKQGEQGQVNGGAYINTGALFFGGWYRHAFGNSDAVIALVGFKYDYFKIGYSYDVTVSDLQNSRSGGAHEISIVLNFDESELVKQRRRAERFNDCFGIFR